MRRRAKYQKGVALVLTLSMLVLITILVIGLSSILRTERSTAATNLDHQKAEVLADMARDHAVAILREGISTAEMTYNSADSTSRKFWASEPGKITVFKSDGTVDSTWNLSSGSDVNTPYVDLNQATFGGSNPIASASSVGGTTAPAMEVNWINILQDPKAIATANNPIVGRYAFWVDDESSKVNVNTADGSSKYVSPDYAAAPSSAPASFGNGLPTEINLQGLLAGAANLTATQAESISSVTGIRPGAALQRLFNSPREVLQSAIPPTTFQDNNFDLTSTSRSPELNIFGEPKIYLLTTGSSPATPHLSLNLALGAYPAVRQQQPPLYPVPVDIGQPLKQVYPSSNPFQAGQTYYGGTVTTGGLGNQLPNFAVNPAIKATPSPAVSPLPQYALTGPVQNVLDGMSATAQPPNPNYNLGLRIAQYLKGYNSQGQPIQWPQFPGSGSTGFAGKYTDRQIDSIALQILDLIDRDEFPESNVTYSIPDIMPKGWLSGLPVIGLGRAPHINQILITFTVVPGSPQKLNIVVDTQWYLPKEFRGMPLNDIQQWVYGDGRGAAFNSQDSPQVYPTFVPLPPPAPQEAIIGRAPMGGTFPYWACTMLNITADDGVPAEDGLSAGVDLMGNDPLQDDPDRAHSKLYHPEAFPLGSGPNPAYIAPALDSGNLADFYNPTWNAGDYHSLRTDTDDAAIHYYNLRVLNSAPSVGINTGYPLPHDAQPFTAPITTLHVNGGIAIWTKVQNHAFAGINPVPLDSIRGPLTGEDPQDPNVNAALLAAVIPMPPGGLTIPVSQAVEGGPPAQSSTVQVLMKVADPYVNSFPGDWTVIPNPLPSDITMTPKTAGTQVGIYQNGADPTFTASQGGDPDSYWLPEINQNIPKSQRLPSVGYLQYIRTGVMPDKQYAAVDPTKDGATQAAAETASKGTPFRLLSLAPSYDPAHPTLANPGQKTLGGDSYPDWAMLDLFTVPVSPQPLGGTGTTPSELEMTYGGSTPGRVNVNSPASLAPFPASAGVTRQIPLQAVFKGIQAHNSYDLGSASTGMTEAETSTTLAPSPVDEKALANDISAYETSLGRPLMMPGEIANVPGSAAGIPGIGDYLYVPTNLPSPPNVTQPYQARNDLLRQVLGNLTTQSNTFSVWAIGQSIKKIPGNHQYGEFENGDIVQGQARTHYIVERYIDPGTDGVPGNASASTGSAGADGIIGTPDDLIDGDDTSSPVRPGANPLMAYPLPYKYRVISSDEISN